jgi:hypothetical protein
MTGKVRWIVGTLLLLSLLTATGLAIASALASTTYLPAIYKQPTPIASPTPTVTPTPLAEVAITHIEADPPGPDIESEYVTIKNRMSSTVNLTGWVLKDKTSTSFKFPTYSLGAGREVNVWSRAKTSDDPDSDFDLYWGLNSAIWDNLRDCAYLYDKDGDQVDEFCYDRPH